MPLVRIETRIAATAQVCFDLMRDAGLHARSLAHTGERAVAGRTRGLFEAGDEVTWEARHFGVRLRLTSRITRCEPPHLFEDIQARGPFVRFTHVHRFVTSGGHTVMIDEFDYTAPLGLLGRLADLLFLKRYLQRLLQGRGEYIKTEAETRTASMHNAFAKGLTLDH
jgi:ligand-binding SRPBCC domain-containing protein